MSALAAPYDTEASALPPTDRRLSGRASGVAAGRSGSESDALGEMYAASAKAVVMRREEMGAYECTSGGEPPVADAV